MGNFRKIVALTIGAPLTQRIVQGRVEKELQKNPMINVRHNIVRSIFGKGNKPIEDILAETAESRTRIIMLIAGVDDEKGDISKHAIPFWYGFTQRDNNALRAIRQFIRDVDAEGGEVARISRERFALEYARKQVAFATKNPVEKATMEEYQTVVLKKVQQRLYGQTPADVSIITNANTDDFLQTIDRGGGNTTMITHAHANRGLVSMTNGLVFSEDIQPPKEKLRAFLMHGCGEVIDKKDEGKPVIGTGLAEEVWAPEGCPLITHLIRNPFLDGIE